MKKSIAFFDFDGTITTKDTMLELIKFHFGNFKFIKGLIYVLPWIAGMKTKLVSHQLAKEKLLSYFFKNMAVQDFQSICDRFLKEKMPSLIRNEALNKIKEHQDSDTIVVVVSASAINWVKPWCEELNIECIASNLEIVDGQISGKLKGLNCNYDEKPLRIKSMFDLSQYNIIYCYGDSNGDQEMLKLATHPFYRPFRQKKTG